VSGGVRNGMVALVKKKMESEGIDSSQLIVCRHIIRQEYSSKILHIELQMTTVVSVINLLK
jgi:hypothetical protein